MVGQDLHRLGNLTIFKGMDAYTFSMCFLWHGMIYKYVQVIKMVNGFNLALVDHCSIDKTRQIW